MILLIVTTNVTIKWLVSSSQMTTDSTSVNNDLQVRTSETLRMHPMWIFIKTFLDWISFGFSIFRLIWGKYQETVHEIVQVLGALWVLLWEGFNSITLSLHLSVSHTHTHTHTWHWSCITLKLERETFITFAWLLHQPDTCAMPVGRQRRGNPRGRSSYKSFLQEVNSACDTPTTSPSSILGSSQV